MKVQYVIPGILTPQKGQALLNIEEVSSFRSRLQQLMSRPLRRWKELLQLDAAPKGIEWIPAPPQPEGLALHDSESLRQQWRELLRRHALKPPGLAHAGSKSEPKLQQMLALLVRYHVLEQELAAHYLSESQ